MTYEQECRKHRKSLQKIFPYKKGHNFVNNCDGNGEECTSLDVQICCGCSKFTPVPTLEQLLDKLEEKEIEEHIVFLNVNNEWGYVGTSGLDTHFTIKSFAPTKKQAVLRALVEVWK